MEWIKIFGSDAEAKTRVPDNSTQLLIIGGKRVCLARHNDEFYAVQDRCTHNGESLSKGKINFAGEVICPWHGYRFDLRSGRACDSSSDDLETYPIKADNTGFFIGF
jgi:nitrite reductase/ring-hydroxylating ferredoxin subunit